MIAVPVNLGPRSYRVLVGAGTLSQVGPELARLGAGRRVALVTDAVVGAAHGEAVRQSLRGAGFAVAGVEVPEGEAAKTLATAERVWDAYLAQGLDRTSTVVALGGGAVGDLAGFTAATYMRGIGVIQVPTTLLAQVDASIGGKTAIDHPRAKNLIGAFHQPRAVVLDTRVLGTLPERQYRSGLAEVIKHGIVLDADYFALLEGSLAGLRARDPETLTQVIAGSCRLKARVVEQDEQESELRHVLNYGHTVGHAVEAATGFARFTHGEAVSLGIAAEARLAQRLGLAAPDTVARQVDLLRAVGLPVAGLGASPEAVLEALGRDKKARDGRVPFVLAPAIGRFRLVFDVPRAAVLETLAELG